MVRSLKRRALHALLLALATGSEARAQDGACLALTEIPDATQVVWISPVRRQVGAHSWMEVVRLGDLESWVAAHDKDPVRMLQAAGIVGRKAGARATEATWKVTIFDVERSWMCRPVAATVPGTDLHGVQACEEPQQKAASGARPGFTGCGYAVDSAASTRGLDVFRIRWEDAASQGFCVMPFDRFLTGL
jgi:hypothetical protein